MKTTKPQEIQDFTLKIVDNSLFFDVAALVRAFGTTEQTIANWKKRPENPLEHSPLSNSRQMLYPFFQTITWYFDNINQDKASRRSRNQQKHINFDWIHRKVDSEEQVDIADMPITEADRLLKIEKYKQAQIETKALQGQYIPIEEFAKGQAEPIMVLLSDFRALLSRWTYKLQNLQSDEIEKIIDADIHRTIEYIKRFLESKEVEVDSPTFFDALDTVKSLLDSGLTPTDIVALAEK